MSNDKNINNFSPADIEKYFKGLLSPQEMNALEKAALDDPFLAEAMEGYTQAGIRMDSDIRELKNRLANRIEKRKLTPVLVPGKSTRYQWWKIAAMILMIAGAGWLVYQTSFNNQSPEIAQSGKKESLNNENKDSFVANPNGLTSADTSTKPIPSNGENNRELVKDNQDFSPSREVAQNNKSAKLADNTRKDNNDAQAYSPTITKSEEKESVADAVSQNKIDIPAQAELQKENYSANAAANENRVKLQSFNAQKQKASVLNKNQQSKIQPRTFVFSGRVTDQKSNALPFSNISNTEDSIGTYSDASGHFTLISTDSILKVRVSSLGFESSTVQLFNNNPHNKILLAEDRSSLSETQLSNKKVNSKRARDASMLLEKPEPSDGWTNYDIYLANNLKVPENFTNKPSGTTGEVELSFDISKDGLPVNITVKKSLCESCDKEAIRLVKEGPKWKRKNKKGKATVTVAF